MSLLENYHGPEDLKKYSRSDLQKLAAEVRKLIIEVVAKNGGHLAPSLGAVELAIALHAVLDTPKDKVIWDVGHQAYAHKILTDRLDRIRTIRQYQGLSGFPKRTESSYDAFSVGHASTSISAAVGMARARDIQGEKFSVFSIVGDGSFSGGMILEALNNSGKLKNFVVILNDNGMSISKPVGMLSTVLTTLRLSNIYTGFKHATEKILQRIPMIGVPLRNSIEKLVNRTGAIIIKELGERQYAGFFQDFGFTYVGPIDGHNISMLMAAIKYAKNFKSPLLLHVLTRKGKGYLPAEKEPIKFHGIASGLDIDSGEHLKTTEDKSYTKIFAEELLKHAAENKDICAITAAMAEGTGLNVFAEKYPERFFDVGIAEEHAVTFAGGLATQGLRPVVAIYSTFLQRAYDQVIQDVVLQQLPVFFALDRAGLVGDDGPTHHGVFDISYLRHIPGLIVTAPKDGNELKDLILTGLKCKQAFTVRYPRGQALFWNTEREAQELPLGQAELVYGQSDAETVIWAIGSMVQLAVTAAKRSAKSAAVVNARFVKPLDKKLLRETAGAKKIITIEENVVMGGFGSAILEALQEMNLVVPVKMLGLPDKFIEHGDRERLLKDCGLTVENITSLI